MKIDADESSFNMRKYITLFFVLSTLNNSLFRFITFWFLTLWSWSFILLIIFLTPLPLKLVHFFQINPYKYFFLKHLFFKVQTILKTQNLEWRSIFLPQGINRRIYWGLWYFFISKLALFFILHCLRIMQIIFGRLNQAEKIIYTWRLNFIYWERTPKNNQIFWNWSIASIFMLNLIGTIYKYITDIVRLMNIYDQ